MGKKKRGAGRPRADLPNGVEINSFAKWMKERGLKVEAVASLLDVTISAVYGYRRGTRPPSREVASRIEEISRGKVLASSWD